MPFSGLRPLYKALTERRYTPYFGFYHFTDSLYKSAVQCRAWTAFPLQQPCRTYALRIAVHAARAGRCGASTVETK